MDQNISRAPFPEIDWEIPEQLLILYHPPSGRYGCCRFGNVHGLACFEQARPALEFAYSELSEVVDELQPQLVSFDKAREIAKSRGYPVESLIVLDKEIIHFVK
jgi:hypothetical protein